MEYLQAGVNRISVGVQCLDSDLLAEQGRIQSMENIEETFEILTNKELPEVKLKELVGHTPVQVVAGVIVGIFVSIIMCYTLPQAWL